MSHYRCSFCIFGADCPRKSGVACRDFSPIDEEILLEDYIERRKEEYRAEWEQYTAEDRAPLLF